MTDTNVVSMKIYEGIMTLKIIEDSICLVPSLKDEEIFWTHYERYKEPEWPCADPTVKVTVETIEE